MNPKVLFEDDNLLVLDKPSGWIVNEAETTGAKPVIQTWLSENFNYEISKSREYRSGIVHRLDKETSGVLLVAKNKESFANLQSQFKNREVKKTYIALVHGIVDPPEGEIKVSVGRTPWNRKRFGVIPGGREAETKYKRLSVFRFRLSAEYYSFVELYPKTGRTHQIRVHLKHIGHPIVGDEFYAGRKTSRKDRVWCPRVFLHASAIFFKHPETGEILNFESPLPTELDLCLKKLSRTRSS